MKKIYYSNFNFGCDNNFHIFNIFNPEVHYHKQTFTTYYHFQVLDLQDVQSSEKTLVIDKDIFRKMIKPYLKYLVNGTKDQFIINIDISFVVHDNSFYVNYCNLHLYDKINLINTN